MFDPLSAKRLAGRARNDGQVGGGDHPVQTFADLWEGWHAFHDVGYGVVDRVAPLERADQERISCIVYQLGQRPVAGRQSRADEIAQWL